MLYALKAIRAFQLRNVHKVMQEWMFLFVFLTKTFLSGKLSSLLLDSPQKRHRTHLIRLYELPLHHVSVKLISYLPKSSISSPLSSTDEKPLKRTHAYVAVISRKEHKRNHAPVCAPRYFKPFIKEHPISHLEHVWQSVLCCRMVKI